MRTAAVEDEVYGAGHNERLGQSIWVVLERSVGPNAGEEWTMVGGPAKVRLCVLSCVQSGGVRMELG